MARAAVDLFAHGRIPVSLSRFMELMNTNASRDLVRKINRFTHNMESVRTPDATKDSRLVQNFLAQMEEDIVRHRMWSSLSDTDKEIMLEGVETYCMTKLYKRLFGRYKEDQARDASISSRLFALQFVTPGHLDISSDMMTSEGLGAAMRELQKINAFKVTAPRDKLSAILNCSHVIMDLLRSNSGEMGADAFVPVLNYVVIKTQPIHLISNIEFIRRFRMKSRLVSYTDYYFTQLCAAAYFIETVDCGSFTNGRQEFLSSFLQQGLISWKQYEEALYEGKSGELRMPRSLSFHSTGDVSEPSQMDGDFGGGSSIEELRSVTDDYSGTSTIDWANVTGVAQLETDGQLLVSQMAASGDLESRHAFLSVNASDLKVESVDQLLADYKTLALSHVVLSEAVEQKDSANVLRLITEYEIKAQWRSCWPTDGQLLTKYPFLCSSFQDLTFKDIVQLLNDYKRLILRCECLIAGIKRRIRHDPLAELSLADFAVHDAPNVRDASEQEPPLITRLSETQPDRFVIPENLVSSSVVPLPQEPCSVSSEESVVDEGTSQQPRGALIQEDQTENQSPARFESNLPNGNPPGREINQHQHERTREINHVVSIGPTISSQKRVFSWRPKSVCGVERS